MRKLLIGAIVVSCGTKSEAGEMSLPKGKTWVHADQSTPGMLNALVAVDYVDFHTHAIDVREQGTAVLRGQKVTIYSGAFDTAKWARETEGETAQQFAALAETNPRLPVKVWLDEEGRPARIATDIRSGDGGRTKAMVDILEWGVPVDVQPPPAAQIAEASELSAG
jgi:hypothetical protein